MLLNDLRTIYRHFVLTRKREEKTQQNNRHALIGEEEFPLQLKSLLTIQRGSNVFFYFDFILHQ